MTNASQPVANVSEFALPGRMRELAARILWDLFTPLREEVAQIQRTSADGTAASERKLEQEANKLADAMATAKSELVAQRDFIQTSERRAISPIEQELNRCNDAKATLARQRESLLGQLKSRGLAIPVLDASAGGNNPPLILDEAVRMTSGQFDDLQRAFRGPILSDFQHKKGILRKWQWIIGVLLGLFALLLGLCFIARNPPVAYPVLTAIGLGVLAPTARGDLRKENIPQGSFFRGISLAVNEVQRGFKRFSTLAASVEAGVSKLIADLEQQRTAKMSRFAAQRKRAEQTFEHKRGLIMSDGNAAEAGHLPSAN